jgi:cobalamin biosynthesis Mg chelatase CobN
VIDRAGLLDPSGTAHSTTVSMPVRRKAVRGTIVAVSRRRTCPVPGTRQVRFRHPRDALFRGFGHTRCKDEAARRRVATPKRKDHVPTWLWIVIIVIVVLAALGYFRRGRSG